jgi:PAS domain S-box-containing protein
MTDGKKSEESLNKHGHHARFTSSKKVHESIRQSDFRSLFENSLDSILITKPDGSILSANPAACRMFSMSEEEIRRVGRAGLMVFDEKAKLALKEREKAGKAKAELTLRRKDGSTFEGEVTSNLFKDREGTVKTSMIIRDITERKKAEKAMRESEERLNLAQKIGHVGSWEYYTKKDKAFWSDELFRIFGLKPQLYGPEVTAYVKLIYPDDREKINTMMEKVLFKGKAGDKASFDYRILRQDGSLRIIHSERMIREVDQDGKSTRIMGVEQDITEHKKAEEALRLSEEKYRQIVTTSQEGILTIDTKGKITFMNQVLADWTGIDVEASIGTSVFQLVAKEDLEKVYKRWDKRKTGDTESYDFKFKRKDGSDLWVLVNGAPINDAAGNFNGLLAMISNITERKKAEEALKESEALYRTLFDNSDDGFILLEPMFDETGKACDFRFLKVNRAYERQTGRKAVVVEGKMAKEVAPDLEQEWVSLIGEVVKSGKSVRYENFNARTSRWYDAHYFPWAKGQIGILFRDITERKDLERQLKDHERLAAIGQTARMVGHDIRNPLQSMIGNVYLLKSSLTEMPESEVKREVAESFDDLEQNILYIDKIVSDLQDYAKPLKPEFSSVNLYDLIVSSLKSIRIPDNVTLSINVIKVSTLRTDPEFIRRALTNLINNAVQAMPNGGKLDISGFRNKGEIWISVYDTGIGIPNEVKPKLFAPMVTTKAKGLGLGLAVVKRLIEALDGSITFESKKGKGTKFIIKLPVER